MDYSKKILKAKILLQEAEVEIIKEKGFCPYELGYTLRKLDEAIEFLNINPDELDEPSVESEEPNVSNEPETSFIDDKSDFFDDFT